MAVKTRAQLQAEAAQIANETGKRANTASRVGNAILDVVDSQASAGTVFNVTAYASFNAASPAAAFAEADAAAAAVGGTVFVPAGTYGNGTDWVYALSSGVTLDGSPSAILVNCHLTCTGTVGSEIPFTAPALIGAFSVAIPSVGFENQWLRIASCINSNSTDAGANQLGDRNTDLSMLAEFVRVKTGAAGSATLYRGTCFPYSNTPGGDSGSFTTSAARLVTFHQGSRIRNIKFLGKNSSFGECIKGIWCRDLVIENVFADANDISAQMVNLEYCLDCHVRGGRIIGKTTSVPTGSPSNQVVFISCQTCSLEGVALEAGNQSCDITYSVQSTYRGGPSIDCGASDCTATGYSTEGFTSHPGCLRAYFDNCETLGGASGSNGIRIRSRGDRVTNCRLTGFGAAGSGVLIMETALFDCNVSNNRMSGFTYGIEFQCTSTSFATLRSTLGGSVALISKNTITNTLQNGIALIDSPALATFIGPRVLENDIHTPGTHGINIGAYINGTVVEGNRIYGIPSGRRGIIWTSNTKRLYIGTNYIFNVNAAGFAMGGPSVSSMMTDSVTFPGGESEAQLYIGPYVSDAATPLTGILRVNEAYLQPLNVGWQPFNAGLGSVAPSIEMASVGFYGYGSNFNASIRDSVNNLVTRSLGRTISGTGSPSGRIAGDPGMLYFNTLGSGAASGTAFIKTTGTGMTGWVAIA